MGLAIPATLLAAYWGLANFGLLPSPLPGDQQYLADGRLLGETGNDATDASKEKLQTAVERLGKAINDNPDNAPAYYFRAVAHERLGERKLALDDYAEAIRRHKAIVAMSAADRKARNATSLELDLENAYYRCGVLLNDSSKPGDTGQLNEAVADFSQNLVAPSRFCRSVLPSSGRLYETGPAWSGGGQPQRGDTPRPITARHTPSAQAYLKTENEPIAMDDARRALQLDPTAHDACLAFGLALAAEPRENAEKAIAYLDRANSPGGNLDAETRAELARGYFQFGVRLTKDKKPPTARTAIAVFTEAEKLNPKYKDLNKEYVAQNDAVLSGLPPQAPVSNVALTAEQLRLKAKPPATLGQSEFEQVIRPFRFAHQIDANCADAWEWAGRGLAFLNQGDAVSAIGDFAQAISLDPAFAQAYCYRGRAYALTGDPFRAESDLTEAIHLKPQYALAYYYRAGAFLRDRHFEQALANVDTAVEVNKAARTSEGKPAADPKLVGDSRTLYVAIRQSQARAQIAAGNRNEAVNSLLAVGYEELRERFGVETELSPEKRKQQQAQLAHQVAETYRDMGFENFKEKRWTEAIDSFERVISADASMKIDLRTNLALAYAERGHDRAEHGDLAGAVADISRGLGIDPGSAQVCRLAGLASCELARHYHDRGRTSYERVNWSDAIAHLRRAIWLDPKLKYELQGVVDEAQRNLSPLAL